MRASPVLVAALLFVGGFALWFLQPWAEQRRHFFVADAFAFDPHAAHSTEPVRYRSETVVSGFDSAWDVAFLSAADALITEKPGRLWRVNLESGSKRELSGLPEVANRGQGGLLAVVAHPSFDSNALIYLSYAARLENGLYTTRVMRAKLVDDALTQTKVILSAQAESRASHHFGGALLFGPDGHLFVSVGDRGDRHKAQQLDAHNGKILRLFDDGSVPPDNPFIGQQNELPEIFSYGHRNPQGLALDASTGRIWEAEHGPRGGDEINHLRSGLNFGWPVITYGKEYVGGSIGEGASKPGMEQPVHYYVPSIATSGIAYYREASFPEWKGSVFVGALRGQHLNRVQLRDGQFIAETRLLEDLDQRVRSVRISPAGDLYVVTEEGALIRIYR